MKKKVRNSILLALCLSTCFTVGTAFSACDQGNPDGIQFVDQTVKKGPKFLEGALADIYVNETVVLNEYVEFVDEKYTLTITDPNGNVSDLTDEIIWFTEVPGKYVLTYTIHSGADKGTSTFELNVAYPELVWEFTLQNLPYLYGDELVFEDYFNAMNIYASLENYQVVMDSVEVDGEETDLHGQESYVFQSMSDHVFKFHIESADGQRNDAREVISIKYVDPDYMQELTDMGISIYGDLYVEDGNYTMIAGSFCNGNNVWLRRENGPHNLPYIAYNGDYGLNSYVKVDFTGNDMPTLSFFRDTYSKSIFDGSKGFVFTGGFTNNEGVGIHPKLSSSCSLYGPYMLHEYDRGASDTTTVADAAAGSIEDPYPGSFNSYKEGTRYRMIAGFSGMRKGTANLLNSKPAVAVDTIFLDFQCIIIDLDAMEVFSKFTLSTYGIQALGFQDIPLDLENNEFMTGNIVLYGKHGDQTTLDKIYPIITGMTFEEICEAELATASFKEDAPTLVKKGSTLNVSDFVDTSVEDYIFFYRDEAGNTYSVESETFTIEQAGSYTLYYSDGEYLCASLGIFVEDFNPELSGWIADNNLTFFGLDSLSDAHSVKLKAGQTTDDYPSTKTGTNVLSYVGFKGEYGAGDYVAMEFTGKNLPMVSFFNEKITSNPCDGGFGFSVNMSKYSVNTGKELTVHAPYKVFHFEGDGFLTDKTSSSRLLQMYGKEILENGEPKDPKEYEAWVGSQATLQDGVRYGMIMGFSSADRNKTVLNMIIVNLDTKDIVVNLAQPMDYQIGQYDNHDRYTHITGDFKGGITVYGFYEDALTLDKIYPVLQDTSVEEAAIELFGNLNDFRMEYNSSMDENGKIVLQTGTLGYGGNYTGPNTGVSMNQAYMSFVGNYGFNDYVAFDFTGKNMPEVAFFAKNYDNSMYYGNGNKRGVVVASGLTLWDGSALAPVGGNGAQICVSGPYMANFNTANAGGSGNLLDAFNANLARANLQDGKHYRVIMGFTMTSMQVITLKYKLYDLDMNTLIEEIAKESYPAFSNDQFCTESAETLCGSIVLYGKFGAPDKTPIVTTIDKFHGIYEDTTIEAICQTLGM